MALRRFFSAANQDVAMAIRTLLLPLSSTAAGEAALATALMAARHWEAHLVALHVRADRGDVARMAGEGLTGAMIEDMMRAADAEGTRRAAAVRALFDRFVAQHGMSVAPAAPGQRAASARFAIATGREEDRVACAARLADLTVVAHPDADEDVSSSDALHAALFDSGRPVLIAPVAAPRSLGRHVCLAWSGTAEAAAAARAGIGWMQRARSVTVLSARAYQRRGPSAEELADYLALHDIAVSQKTFAVDDAGVGAGMLAAAHEVEADLLIMGAYSSSRLRQLILGGVTRHVLEHADLPVLMCR